MWIKAIVAITLLGLASAALVKIRPGREKRFVTAAQLKAGLADLLHIAEPLEVYPELEMTFTYWRELHGVLKDNMTQENMWLAFAAKAYSLTSQQFGSKEDYPQFNLTDLIRLVELKNYVGNHTDVDRIALAVQPFITEPLSFEDALKYLSILKNTLTEEVNKITPDILLTAFKGGLDKVESLGEIDPFLTILLKRARNIYDGVTDPAVRDIYMDVIAVQIHDMVMNEFLPKAGVRDLKISEEIRKLGVHEFIGEVPDLDTLTAKVQELISRNLTLNETIGIVMELYEWMRTKANSEVDFRALKSIGESLQNKAKSTIPDVILQQKEFDAFLRLARYLTAGMDINDASEFAGLAMGNLVYKYIMDEIFPMANISDIDLAALIKQTEIDKLVKGVVDVNSMAATLQPFLRGTLTMEQAVEVFKTLYMLIEADAREVNANTMQVMAENILDQYQSEMPPPEKYPEEFKEFLTRMHHAYINLPEGEMKEFFRIVMTNTVFERLTGINVTETPAAIRNYFSKDNLSLALGVNVDNLTALFNPMFDHQVDLEEIPNIFLEGLRLFLKRNDTLDRVALVMHRAMTKMKTILPNPVANPVAYKKLLSFVEMAKKSLGKEEGDLLSSIFGVLNVNASNLMDIDEVREALGANFDVKALNRLLQPILDGNMPLEEIPQTFVDIYDMFKNSENRVNLEKLRMVFERVLNQLKVILPDPLAERKQYALLKRYVEIAKTKVDEQGKEYLSAIFDGPIKDVFDDLGWKDRDVGKDIPLLDEEGLAILDVMRKHKNVMKMDEFSRDDLLDLLDRIHDIPEQFRMVMDVASGAALVDAEKLDDIPTALFRALTKDALKSMVGRFDRTMLDSFCRKLSEADATTASDLMSAIDCTDAFRRRAEDGELDENSKEIFLESMERKKPQDQWTEDEWETVVDVAGGGTLEFDKMPPGVLVKKIDTLVEQAPNMDEESHDEIFETLDAAFVGGISEIDVPTFGKLRKLINKMPIVDLEEIPAQKKLEALGSFVGIEMDDEVAAEFAEDVLGMMPDPKTWTQKNLEDVVDLIKYDSDLVDEIPIETLANGMSAIVGDDFDDTEASTFAERFLEDDKYKDPSNWDLNLLTRAAAVTSAMPPKFLAGIDGATFVQAISSSDKFAKVEFPKSSGRKILEKVKSTLTDITAELTPELIGKLGKMIKSFQCDELKQMSPTNLKNSLNHFNKIYEDMVDSSRRCIIETLKELPGGLAEVDKVLGHFIRLLTPDEFGSLRYDSIDPKEVTPSDIFNINPSPGQARSLYNHIKAWFGSPDTAAGNWTLNFWRFLRRGVCGMPCSDIMKIPLGSKLPNIFKMFADMDECLDDGQLRCMANRMKTLIWNTTSDEPIHSKITKSDISYYGRFLPYLNVTDLDKFDKYLCGHLVRVIGKYPLDNVPRSHLIKLKDFALRCAGKQASGTILKEEIRMAGDILCGIEVEELDRLSPKLLKNHFRDFSEKCDLPADVAQELLTRAIEVMNLVPKNITVKDMVRLGPVILCMSESDLKEIQDDVLYKGSARLIKGFKEKQMKRQKRVEMGLPVQDMCTSATQGNFIKRIIEVFVSKRKKKNNRTKRSVSQASDLTCSDLKKFGFGVNALTLAQLDIATSHFSTCADFLGAEKGWSSSQKKQLAETAKAAWGTPSTWSTSTLISAGAIAQGLTNDELGTLSITSIDAISGLGQFTGWTPSQLSTVFIVWLSGTQSGMATNIDSSELQSIGEFTCGASAAQIETIPVASYKGAAAKVGLMTSCDDAQLTAYANLAKNNAAFGPISTWDAATIATVGNVIGGLTSSEIGSLTQTQIEALGTSAIQSIPAASFSELSVSQLGYFSLSQANAATSDQTSALSPAKKAALSGAGAIIIYDTPDTTTLTPDTTPSGAGAFKYSLLTFLVLVLPYILF